MASSNSAAPAPADGGDDLDQLLDSALDDFTNLDLSASAAPKRYSLWQSGVSPVGVKSCSS
jgi:peroxin-19